MREIYNLMLTNLMNVGIGILIFLLAYVSNFSFSIYYNIKVLGQKFNRGQMWNSILKIFAFGIGCTSLVVVITALPLFATYVGLPLPDEFANNLTTVSVLGLPMYASVKLCLEALKKMKKVIESGTITLTEFEDVVSEASSKQAEEDNQAITEIIDNLKSDKSDKYYDFGNEDLTEDEITENYVNHIKMGFGEEINNKNTEEEDKDKSVQQDSSQQNSSQQAPDDVNFNQMEAEQLEG